MKFPQTIMAELGKKYWHNKKKFKALLKGKMEFPLKMSLKAPTTSGQILANMDTIQEFIQVWQKFNDEFELCQVEFQSKNFQQFGMVTLPYYLIIENRIALISIFTQDKQVQLQHLQNRINRIIHTLTQCFEIDSQELLEFLIDNLESFEHLSDDEINQLLQILPQLKYKMGNGLYLRNLPIVGVDTKFIEQQFKFIENLLNYLYHNEVLAKGGLMAWLGCQEKPNDWLLVKPLCKLTKNKLANLPLLRLNSQTLLNYELPADKILVIENEQACLPLLGFTDVIAIAGGGKNIGWLKADWLKHKKVYYWGDIDGDGLLILNLARQYCSHIVPIMMNKQTVLKHQSLMVNDKSIINEVPKLLNIEETDLFLSLKNGEFVGNRLEQERLDKNFIDEQLTLYLNVL